MLDDYCREDLSYWVATDCKTAQRVLKLIEDVLRDLFQGIGKPEPLKHLDSGLWSRWITQEHRLGYLVEDDRIISLRARYHYDP